MFVTARTLYRTRMDTSRQPARMPAGGRGGHRDGSARPRSRGIHRYPWWQANGRRHPGSAVSGPARRDRRRYRRKYPPPVRSPPLLILAERGAVCAVPMTDKTR
jgi:hypothetical protein